jgi:hypothetical protein
MSRARHTRRTKVYEGTPPHNIVIYVGLEIGLLKKNVVFVVLVYMMAYYVLTV